MFLGRLRATHVGKQWVAQGSEIGADVLTVSFELEPASHSPSFVLFSPLALFATMQAQSPSRHSHKSSKASGSSKGTKRARKTGSHPEKTGSHPEKANKDLTMVASEPTWGHVVGGSIRLRGKEKCAECCLPGKPFAGTGRVLNQEEKGMYILVWFYKFPIARSRESREGLDPLGL